jgi:hypothetical protein
MSHALDLFPRQLTSNQIEEIVERKPQVVEDNMEREITQNKRNVKRSFQSHD